VLVNIFDPILVVLILYLAISISKVIHTDKVINLADILSSSDSAVTDVSLGYWNIGIEINMIIINLNMTCAQVLALSLFSRSKDKTGNVIINIC